MAYTLTLREMDTLLGGGRRSARFRDAAGLEDAGPGRALTPAEARAGLEGLGYAYPSRVVAFINLKGGVGKTTSAVTTATRAAMLGFKTCLLDLDSQASATLALGVEPGEGAPVFLDVWPQPAEMLPSALVSLGQGPWLLPSALDNALLEGGLANPASQKRAVAGVCQHLFAMGFDLVLIDCPPSLGTAVVSSICAADTVVVPLGTDAFSFRGAELTLEEIASIAATFGLEQPRVRLLLTMLDGRMKLSAAARAKLAQRHPDLLLPQAIRTSTEFARALERRESVFARQRRTAARQDYEAFVNTLLGLDELLAPGRRRRERV